MPKAAKRAFDRRLAFEEFRVHRIGAGITALDIIDAQPIEQSRDLTLVLQRKIDARRLRAVAHRCVEEIEAFARHSTEPLVKLG